MPLTIPLPLTALAAQLPVAEASLLNAFSQAGTMGKLVLLLLVTFSVGSWAVMFWKLTALRRASKHNARFLEAFHKSRKFSEVNALAKQVHASPLLGLFQAGYAEIDTQIKTADAGSGDQRRLKIRSLEAVGRSLQRAMTSELAQLQRATPFLATTASATPFIGLFGTVWGIMVAFERIGSTGSTSLDTIAPGIAEALINTAAGLAAAIPALISYNYFAHRLKRMRAVMEDFANEFLNLTDRNFT